MTDSALRMRDRIAAWHREQGYTFRSMAEALERDGAPADQIQRAQWAAASHHAHATHIARMQP